MPAKKQCRSVWKLFSLYREKQEECLNETDADRFLCNNVFDISQSQPPIARVSKGSNKNSFAVKLLHFCDLKTKQSYSPQEKQKLQRKTGFFNGQFSWFPQDFCEVKKRVHIPLTKSKIEIRSTNSKKRFAQY